MKTVVYDHELDIEAYRFDGIIQPFPNHFHEYYVIGMIENGKRYLSCKNTEYTIEEGSLLLFNPGDNHACTQIGHAALDYRSLNISKKKMLSLMEEITGERQLPRFSKSVLSDEEIACCLRMLHEKIMRNHQELEKEETLHLLLSTLIRRYGQPFESGIPECRKEIQTACAFMNAHFAESIGLGEICLYAGLSKSTLLRAFTKAKGITPYRYLENIRINAAKALLEKGAAPIDAAMETGFSDQSHFTNYFNRFIGLPPGAYREIFFDKNESGGKQNEK